MLLLGKCLCLLLIQNMTEVMSSWTLLDVFAEDILIFSSQTFEIKLKTISHSWILSLNHGELKKQERNTVRKDPQKENPFFFFSGENLMCINLLELTIVWFNFVIKISSKVDWVLFVLILLHRGLQSCIIWCNTSDVSLDSCVCCVCSDAVVCREVQLNCNTRKVHYAAQKADICRQSADTACFRAEFAVQCLDISSAELFVWRVTPALLR